MMRGMMCHVPDKWLVYHVNGVHGGAETLHIKLNPAADGVAYVVTHNGNIRVEFLFPFLKASVERAEKAPREADQRRSLAGRADRSNEETNW
jgi:hypothetical protein